MIFTDLKSGVMAGFVVTGRYEVRVDALGRIVIPREFRPQITQVCHDQLYLKPLSAYLVALSPAVVERLLTTELGALLDEEDRQRRRELGATLMMATMDLQGRMKIPDECRSVLGSDDHVVVIGTGEDFEIWPQTLYTQLHGKEGSKP